MPYAYGCFEVARPEPRWNEEVTRHHFGEDGPGWYVQQHRQMFIQEQIDAVAMDADCWFVIYEQMDESHTLDEELCNDC